MIFTVTVPAGISLSVAKLLYIDLHVYTRGMVSEANRVIGENKINKKEYKHEKISRGEHLAVLKGFFTSQAYDSREGASTGRARKNGAFPECARTRGAQYGSVFYKFSIPRSPSSLLVASRSGLAVALWWVPADCWDGSAGE